MDRDEKIEKLLTEIRDNQLRQIELSHQGLDAHNKAQGGIKKWLIPLLIVAGFLALWSFILPFLSTPAP